MPLVGPRPGREGAAGDDPEPGDLRIARNGTSPRAEEEPLSSPRAGQLPPLILVLGGARSGKSRFAEALVEGAARCGTYCATAEAKDDEMAARIAAHRAHRGAFWHTIEAPLAVADAIITASHPERPLLVDCLTLWLSNLLMADAAIDEAFASLHAALRDAAGDDPEPGDLRIAPLDGGSNRHDSSGGGGAFVVTPRGAVAPADPDPGRRSLGQERLCRGARRRGRPLRHLLRDRRGEGR